MRKLLFALGLVVLLLLVSCTQRECKISTDCPAVGKCYNNICLQGQCVAAPVADCCGNSVCDSKEDACLCNKDCAFPYTENGKCEGKVQLESPYRKNTLIDADNAEYYCAESGCIIGIPESKVQTLQLHAEHNNRYVRFQVVTSWSDPFVLGQGQASVKIKLLDHDANTVRLPVTVTQVQLLSADQLIGESVEEMVFTQVGEVIDVPITISMVTQELESMVTLSAKVDYAYNMSGIQRDSFVSNYKPVLIINPARGELP